jgi:hypothetical protein
MKGTVGHGLQQHPETRQAIMGNKQKQKRRKRKKQMKTK